MAANNETRILKNNSVEELRQKSNEISLHLGDNNLLDSRLGDKVFSYTASAGQTIFDDARIEFKPEETVDNTAGYIIFTGTPTIPASFIAGASVSQSGGFSATIVSISTTKLLVKNSSGTFNAGQNLVVGSDNIPHAKIVRIVAESYSKGLLKVTKNGTELVQDSVSTNGFHIPNYLLRVTLTGSPTLPASFTEGATLTQSGGFSGVLLSASSSQLLFKTNTGSFSDTQNLGAPHTDASNRIAASNISSHVDRDAAFGTAIELNTPASGSDAIVITTTNLVDAITEVQDDIGNIANLNTNNTNDIVLSINELEVGLRGTSNNLVATDLTNMTANNVVSAILEHETDIGDVADINNASGYSATSAVTGITELQSHVGTKASLTTTDKTNLVAAINEVDANADASVKLTSGSSQTLNSDFSYTSGKTFTFPSGSTLDIRQGSLLTGSGGGELAFDTAFLTLTVNDTSNTAVNQFGLEGRRAGSGTDVRVQWNELQVSGSKPARAWQLVGLNDSSATNTADIVTFYNAKDLIANNTESGINATWDSTNQNFDFNVDDFTITLAGDLTGNVTITDLASATLTATVAANSVALGTDTTGDYIGTITGTANEITVTGSGTEDRDVTLALPDDVTIGQDLTVTRDAVITRNLNVNGNTTLGNQSSDTVSVPGNMTITGDLTVNGTNTILNTSTLEVEDTLILTGTSNTEPTTGGFGIETRSFTGVGTHANNASNVTGSHSIVYNFATDRWEADGSLILSVDTVGAPNIEQNGTNKGDLAQDNSLDFKDGIGIHPAVNLVGGASGDFEVAMDLQVATSSELGGIKIGYTDNARNYALELDGDNEAYVNVPWTDTVYTLPAANATTLGGVELFSNTVQSVAANSVSATANRTYGLQFNSDGQGVVNVPWTDTTFTLPQATATVRGGVELFSNTVNTMGAESVTATEGRSYGIQLNSDDQMVVNVPWVNTEYSAATTSAAGLQSAADKTKLDGIEAGANLYTFEVARAGNTFGTESGDATVGDNATLTIAGGSNIQVNRSGTTITIQNPAPDTGTPAILSDGSSPTLNSGISAAEIRSLISAGTSSLTLGTTSTTALAGNTTIPQGTITSLEPGPGIDFVPVGGGSALNSITTTGRIQVESNQIGHIFSIGRDTNDNIQVGTTNIGFLLDGGERMRILNTGDVHADGNLIAYSTTISDERLKENIQVVEEALYKVSQLSGYTFNYKHDGKSSAGLIAQEVEKVLPSAVSESELPLKTDDGKEYKTLEYDQVIALLVESVKELKAEIEELKKHK